MLLFSNFVLSLALTLFTGIQEPKEGYQIEVRIQNLKSNEGAVLVALYNSEESFLNQTFMGEVSRIENKECRVVFKQVPAGIYAVSYVHDRNENGKMDTNFMGIPKEDYGCSNNAKGLMGPPKWEDAKFELTASTSLLIN